MMQNYYRDLNTEDMPITDKFSKQEINYQLQK